MSLWYSILSMGSFIDGDGNIIRWKHIEELQNIQEQGGLNLANKLSSNHMQLQLLCWRCDWASRLGTSRPWGREGAGKGTRDPSDELSEARHRRVGKGLWKVYWASCILFNTFSKGTYVFTTLQCHSESLIHVVCVRIQFERKKCFIFPIYRSNTRMKSYDSYCIEWKFNRLPP
jgi:hypothetical protein